ncbi:hypothetical protein H4219_004219 [Mycoemilia scoparia]|uniref:Protein phosphatase n=1 Tax=Mycoemilia scoparia TaxID=417184 RepID=A0A9W8DS81_9FUNG|nr:hypothetical protein H4219_004219 [Mycoemilia scoparia]
MFSHSAAGIPKNASKIPINQGNTVLDDSGEPELSTGSGEDAFFHRSDAMGVADGVGGWAGDSKANAGLFARRLMHHAHEEIARFDDFDDEMFVRYAEASPVEILRQAYENTLEDFRSLDLKGSSTACIVLLRDDELRVANLGDCGLTVVRHGDMIFRTEEQQHSFNFPYQLGTGKHSDKPTDAQIFRLKVRKGDIIIVGSDGLFDNLFDEDILEEVNRLLPPVYRAEGGPKLKVHYSDDAARSHSLAESTAEGEDDVDGGSSSRNTKFSDAIDKKASAPAVAPDPHQARARLGFSLPQFHIDPKAISDAIAYRAKYVSEESRYVSSPFQTRAIQEGLYYQGGKKDDISVVVAIITDLEDSPDRRL